ncbi:UNVERIFIED_CONTAM: hypothetical protein FKN15_060592 [Acipenser sinensis]
MRHRFGSLWWKHTHTFRMEPSCMNETDAVAELTSAIPKPLQFDLLNKPLTRDTFHVPCYCASAMGCTGEYSADEVQMQLPVLSGEPVILKITSKKS